ncbi:short-chain fatty acid transporter [Brevibacterium yomogidense]|uniref:Short chain fatty acids transporter n=1 Tax=Brevibacterium yomogidense TaxID=946573 RepID=A0A1X6WTU0_9MICO|nr:TIGR00366 family protein [Brevibacterium yomogidense]SLM88490.1 Short chain fatty acids transporter [Brevibacterium yomogidense]
MKSLAAGLSRAFYRFLPESLVVAVFLTFVTFILAIAVERQNPIDVTRMWGGSAWDLLAFSMQIAMLLLTGYMLANTPLVDRGLNVLASRISSPRVAVGIATFAGALGTWLNVGFGLVIGVVLARKLARTVPGLHYPLAVAGGYAGFSLYGIGLSGTIPLTIATPGHILEEQMGIIPTSETIFHPIVLATSIVVILVMPVFLAFLHPSRKDEVIEFTEPPVQEEAPATAEDEARNTFADRLNANPLVGILLGAVGLFYAVLHFSGGNGVDFDIINLTFLSLALLLFARPNNILAGLRTSIGVVAGVLLQYPLYAGIMGVLAGSGLMITFAGGFVAISTPETLPFFSFLAGGLINLFAPSGGAQWAVQGPIMIEAAQQMGANHAATALGVAYGDQWTNAIQPFWIIPVLAISGIKLREVMGYLFLVLIFLGVVYGASILLLGFL